MRPASPMRIAISILALASLFGLSACMLGEPGAKPQTTISAPAPAGGGTPSLAAVAAAPAGAVEAVDDPALGGAVTLSVLEEYDAASGRRCKRVAIQGGSGGYRSRVACAGTGGWYWTAASLT